MIINDGIVQVITASALTWMAAAVTWCLRKLTKLSVDVALIKQRLHMK